MSPTIFVVGSINYDTVIHTPRLPRAGETQSARSVDKGLGGKGLNQAIAAARAGASVRMIGAIGRTTANPVLDLLTHNGVNVTGIEQVDTTETGSALVMVDEHGENSILIFSGANHHLDPHHLRRQLRLLRAEDTLVLQGELHTETTNLAARIASTAGARILWNAAPPPTTTDQVPDGIDVLIVNDGEMRTISALYDITFETVHDGVEQLGKRLNCDVICTQGPHGATYTIAGYPGHLPAPQVSAVDTAAAGDTFAGYVSTSPEADLLAQLPFALTAASLAVTRHGAASSIPHSTEVQDFTSITERLTTP